MVPMFAFFLNFFSVQNIRSTLYRPSLLLVRMTSVKSGEPKELGAGSGDQGQEKGVVQMEEEGRTVCPTRVPVITSHSSSRNSSPFEFLPPALPPQARMIRSSSQAGVRGSSRQSSNKESKNHHETRSSSTPPSPWRSRVLGHDPPVIQQILLNQLQEQNREQNKQEQLGELQTEHTTEAPKHDRTMNGPSEDMVEKFKIKVQDKTPENDKMREETASDYSSSTMNSEDLALDKVQQKRTQEWVLQNTTSAPTPIPSPALSPTPPTAPPDLHLQSQTIQTSGLFSLAVLDPVTSEPHPASTKPLLQNQPVSQFTSEPTSTPRATPPSTPQPHRPVVSTTTVYTQCFSSSMAPAGGHQHNHNNQPLQQLQQQPKLQHQSVKKSVKKPVVFNLEELHKGLDKIFFPGKACGVEQQEKL